MSHTLNKYCTDLTRSLKLKKISPALKKKPLKHAETLQSPIYQKNAEAF